MGERILAEYLRGWGESWAYFWILTALTIYIVSNFWRGWHNFRDYASGNAALTAEKLKLEILKLRYEIEVIKRSNGISGITVESTLGEIRVLKGAGSVIYESIMSFLYFVNDKGNYLYIALLSVETIFFLISLFFAFWGLAVPLFIFSVYLQYPQPTLGYSEPYIIATIGLAAMFYLTKWLSEKTYKIKVHFMEAKNSK